MDPYKETFETWNKVAMLYQEKFMHLDLYNESYTIFCNQLIKENASVLEIGCGPGNITNYLLLKKPDLIIEGIDVAPNMIELARINNPTASFKVMDCRNIDKITSKFNGIICGFCIPYLSHTDCINFLTDSFELLSEKGIIYLSFVEGDDINSGYLTGSTGDRTYFYYYNFDIIKTMLEENNYFILDSSKVHYKKNDGTVEDGFDPPRSGREQPERAERRQQG